ncbi:hypothetical protein BUE80_DR012970 [Diplocarpon rosae]|nr:hypothetical protein BUE80_DR012970 [Diplocarpon rosae]
MRHTSIASQLLVTAFVSRASTIIVTIRRTALAG